MFADKAMSLPKRRSTLGLSCNHYTWVERPARFKNSSLFGPFIIRNLGRINMKFSLLLTDGPNMLEAVPFQHSVIFAGKAMSLPKSGITVGFTFKHYTWTERLAKDKHSSLTGPLVI